MTTPSEVVGYGVDFVLLDVTTVLSSAAPSEVEDFDVAPSEVRNLEGSSIVGDLSRCRIEAKRRSSCFVEFFTNGPIFLDL